MAKVDLPGGRAAHDRADAPDDGDPAHYGPDHPQHGALSQDVFAPADYEKWLRHNGCV